MAMEIQLDVNGERLRYLLVGIWNTVFGYFIGVLTLKLLGDTFHTVGATVVANVISITMSFLTYKTLVFRSKGSWVREYLRAYLVYGLTAILNIFLIWILVDFFVVNIWIAQFYSISITIFVSYLGHKCYTFRKS